MPEYSPYVQISAANTPANYQSNVHIPSKKKADSVDPNAKKQHRHLYNILGNKIPVK